MKRSSRLLGTLAPLLLAAGCGPDASLDRAPGSDGVTSSSLVLDGQKFKVNTGIASTEHCRVPQSRQADFQANRQLLIRRGTTLRGLCTVEATASASGDFEMNQEGFDNRVKISGDNATETSADVQVANQHTAGSAPAIAQPANSLDEANTQSLGKVMEYTLRAPGSVVAYTVPHPFEKGTFEQGSLVHTADTQRNAIWAAGINNNQKGTLSRYHITATEISGASFPGLGTFLANRIPYAVAFHGETSCTTSEVKVGGGIELSFRQGVAEIIREALNDSSLRVHWRPGVCFEGSDDDNFVNAMSVDFRGLQLEQDSTLILGDASRREKVANAVKSVFDCLIDGADNSPTVTSSTSWSADSGGSTYASTGACRRFIAEIELPNVSGGHTLSAGASTCVDGHTAHVDYYRWTTSSSGVGYWVRIGGGNITYSGTGAGCGTVFSSESGYTYVQPGVVGNSASGTTRLRAVIRAFDASGASVPAFFSVQ
ncbi:hypothetical protein [Vitiosangium sp. GDMCC 1.1324]|uniref:hypothetical protein n=1 Tax=Vitiosangium sp. (strain GDMCC 1.1324) TaxID=2138576 RepID=UPI000D3891FD|nr:hypothetical protein [Vitiosangium sp. GDMCC 1.1324]PTL76844.1 hypothetical protein DAT35_47055 [Vitiosangium sp. GDMCC 1.1324]